MNEQNLPNDADKVHVMLSLAGGHQCALALDSANDPLLSELFDALIKRSHNQPANRIFKIPLDEGRSAMYIPSESIVSIATSPPMQLDSTGLILKHFHNVEIPSTYALGAQYIQFDNFLSEAEHQQLLAYALSTESKFVGSTTTNNLSDYRKSKVVYSPDANVLRPLLNRIHAVLPEVLPKLGLSPFNIARIDSQLTASNDGEFYKIHDDNSSPPTATRQLTYVYYFYREPKPFTGGELRMYNNKIENHYWTRGEGFITIEPRNNSIVFFFSGYEHEVLPVHCPSRAFADSRFTINGWMSRAN